MKLSRLIIQNFRSCRYVELQIGGLHALVGGNNAGKSTILRAVEFLLNPSAKSINDESFWSGDTSLEIRVEGVFSDLSKTEHKELAPYLRLDGTFWMARSAKIDPGDESDSEGSEGKIVIGQYCKQLIPEVPWLQDSEINAAKIKEWWSDKELLITGDESFFSFLGTEKPPKVGEWKEKAVEFAVKYKDKIPMQDTWVDKKGYANVLKSTLPIFALVPAVRDVSEESKGTKSSPFGKLLNAVIGAITDEKKDQISSVLQEVADQINPSGGDERVSSIAGTERRLGKLLDGFFPGCSLEIEFEIPTLEMLFSAPKIYVDDGFRTAIENKGHGLQRAVIFSILKDYAEQVRLGADSKRTLILAVEEPELYMHPQAQRTIRTLFRKISDAGDQVMFSTHSALLVDVSYFDEIIRVESGSETTSDGTKVTVTTAWQLQMFQMIADIVGRHPALAGKVTAQSMRDRYSHAYNPRRNEGFFASKIILVEGLTEEYSLPIYADGLSGCVFDSGGISVVECGGKGMMDRLYRIFNELHIPCYMLFDYDKNNSEPKRIEESKELLALSGEGGVEPNGVYVSERSAFFPETWEDCLKKEIPDVEILSQEAKDELGVRDDGSKPLIARYIARRLVNQSPPFVPPSLKRIIEKATAVEWRESCLSSKESEPFDGKKTIN